MRYGSNGTSRLLRTALPAGRKAVPYLACLLFALLPYGASAFFSGDYQNDNGPHQCQQSWPVNCNEGDGGNAYCGGWNILKDLGESENLPNGPGYSTCSTGVRIALPDAKKTQGQAVGSMFNGKVIFAQSGRSRDGRDYGGTVVIQLDLRDGSPQCFLRYMFLDRRDLPEVGDVITSGQRIGSIASDDMSKSRRWWQDNWPGMQPQVKIDIGCDEALANLPHFMPNEPFSGGGQQDPHSCPLTKTRFPTQPLIYLINTDYGAIGPGNGRRTCIVGASEKDARKEFKAAAKQDDREKTLGNSSEYVTQVFPRGLIKRKKTPVYALYKEADTRNALYGLPRRQKGFSPATALGCTDLETLLSSGDRSSATPERIRRLFTHCSNQFIFSNATSTQIIEQARTFASGRTGEPPLNERRYAYLNSDDQAAYSEALTAATSGGTVNLGRLYSTAANVIAKAEWVDHCQPLHLEPVVSEGYSVREILHKSWQELMIEWPQDNNLQPINVNPQFANTRINSYTRFPYERIIDPANPFSPRHIFAETERERYSNYGVQCAATPVDIILGSYPRSKDDLAAANQQTYDSRDADFHSCVRCRIQLNETKEACFADPWSFETPGGCGDSLSPNMNKTLCSNFDLGPHATNPQTGQPASTQDFITYLQQLEDQNGLIRGWLHAIATQESSCRWNAVGPPTSSGQAQGMFQFMFAQSWGDRMNPWLAAKGAAERFGNTAKARNCSLKEMVVEYNCGPACANPNNTETVNYANSISGMLGGATSGCSGGSSTSSSSSPGSVLIDQEGQEGNMSGLGYFNKDSCDAGYASWAGDTSQSEGNCAPLSVPVPDAVTPGTTNWGCERTWGVGGAAINAGDSMHQACARLDTDGFSNTGWCANALCQYSPAGARKRLHMGLDYVTSVGGGGSIGKPVYAAGNGIVFSRRQDGYILSIDHSGHCMYSEDSPACTKRYAGAKGSRTVVTRYIHMGPRVLPEIEEGVEIKRCQQIGTVGSMGAPETGDLHFELMDPTNRFTRYNPASGHAYPPVEGDERYHIFPDDKSCSGGVEDPDGQYGSRGICEYKLPVDARNKEDLTPPGYLTNENYEFPAVSMPNPASPKRGDNFDLAEPGMVYDGAWRTCASLGGADRTTCEELNAEKNYAEPSLPSGNTAFINPLPCANLTSDFGPRPCDDPRVSCVHRGIDLSPGAGDAILAAADGVVVSATPNSCGGNGTVIQHDDGTRTQYYHQAQYCPEVTEGARVVQGQVIGTVGNTGSCTTGPHLHFEVFPVGQYAWGQQTDPLPLIPAPPAVTGSACAAIKSAPCGSVVTGQNVGGGVAGSGKRICVKKPCSVQYDQADTVSQCAWDVEKGGCGAYGDFSQRPGDCCYNITAPVPSVNMLKIRPGFDNESRTPGWSPTNTDIPQEFVPGAWDGQRVQTQGGTVSVSDANRGAPEGYTFYEHFRDHHPYMRWWDTGAESGQQLQERTLAEDDQGRYDTLVGVGIEKSNCGYGGWGNTGNFDGNTSWLELKLYQARVQNTNQMRCIGRYERLFKANAGEDYALQKAGGRYDTYYHGANAATAQAFNWPLGWRGYVSEPEGAYRFPYYKNLGEYDVSASVSGGLDNALPGDIVIWDKDVVGNKRLPQVAYVTKVNRGNTDGDSAIPAGSTRPGMTFFDKPVHGEQYASVVVQGFNQGRFPDACGTTDWAGLSIERTLYKKENQDARDSCINPDLTKCVEEEWNKVKVYRPRSVVRQ